MPVHDHPPGPGSGYRFTIRDLNFLHQKLTSQSEFMDLTLDKNCESPDGAPTSLPRITIIIIIINIFNVA